MRKLFTFFILFICCRAFSLEVIPGPVAETFHYLDGWIYCDSAGTATLEGVTASGIQFMPYTPANARLNKNFTYWIRFKASKKTLNTIQHIRSNVRFRIFELHIPCDTGKYLVYKAGLNMHYRNWPIRNYTSSLPMPVYMDSAWYYLKIKPANTTGSGIFVYNETEELNSAPDRFLIYGIFLGICIIVALYTLIFFITIRETSYLFYAGYVLCFAMFGFVDWGMFIRPLSYLGWNWTDVYYTIPYGLMTVFLLLYARSFLETKKHLPVYRQVLLAAAILRIAIFFTGIFTNNMNFHNPNIDNVMLLFGYIAGIASWIRGYKPSRYLVLGFTVLYVGLLPHAFHMNINLSETSYIPFLFETGAAEIFLFSLALADRFRVLKIEKEEASVKTVQLQEQVIVQLKENEILKDKVNRELEQRVQERTLDLKEMCIRDSFKGVSSFLNACKRR